VVSFPKQDSQQYRRIRPGIGIVGGSPFTVERNIVLNNISTAGSPDEYYGVRAGGITIADALGAPENNLTDTTVANNIVAGNTLGGFHICTSGGGTIRLVNCTIADNNTVGVANHFQSR